METQVMAALQTQPGAGSFLTGPAGSGKTYLAESVAKIQDRRTFFFQAFPGCRKEELYQTILPDAEQPSGFRTQPGILPLATEASKKGKTALILDEWDKTHPSTDAFLLDFLQNGRVSVPGSEMIANRDNLLVFVTLNDERELSEPLLRRLPLIELKPPRPFLVNEALRDTHPEHPYIPALVALYQRSLMVHLSKPATIQELRQLLDAITLLGERADWNQLVFQFVTKNWDDHELLKSAEDLPLGKFPDDLGLERPVLEAKNYELAGGGLPDAAGEPMMPRIQRDWLRQTPKREVNADPEQVFGVVPSTESGYDSVARATLFRNKVAGGDPADLSIAQVGEGEIVVFEALNFERVEEWGLVLQNGGELLLETPHEGEITASMLLDFKAGILTQHANDPDRCRIYSVSETEMLMRYQGTRIRWTTETLEVVTADYREARDFWEYLYGPRGPISAARLAFVRMKEKEGKGDAEPALPPNEQIRDDYLYVLREYRHLKEWFALLINRNMKVWGRITAYYRNLTVLESQLPAKEFKTDNENPESKEEAESLSLFHTLTQPALEYYDANLTHVESELVAFVAKNGEFPPAVEDGGIFGLHEVHTDMSKLKREGLKHYMRKEVREA